MARQDAELASLPLWPVLRIYHLLICYNWQGRGCSESWRSWLSYCLPVRGWKAFLEWKEVIPHEMQSRSKVQGQRTPCANGPTCYFCAHQMARITWSFGWEKHSCSNRSQDQGTTRLGGKACRGGWDSIIIPQARRQCSVLLKWKIASIIPQLRFYLFFF